MLVCHPPLLDILPIRGPNEGELTISGCFPQGAKLKIYLLLLLLSSQLVVFSCRGGLDSSEFIPRQDVGGLIFHSNWVFRDDVNHVLGASQVNRYLLWVRSDVVGGQIRQL